MRTLVKTIILGFAFVVTPMLTGCQSTIPVKINMDDIQKPATSTDLKINILSQAKDTRSQSPDQVGRHTISLLMIPGGTVSTEDSLNKGVVDRLAEALKSVGYKVNLVDDVTDAKEMGEPVLFVQIETLKNYLFSWLYPLGLTFGSMDLSLHLISPKGTEIWKQELAGHGGVMPSLLYMSGFETRVTSDLTANVNQAIKAISSDEFRKAMKSAEY